MKNRLERRYAPASSARPGVTALASGGNLIRGYGAVFYDPGNSGTEYELMPGLVERILPGAFDRVLREKQDVLGLFNHDPNFVLGRVANSTMKLFLDSTGLAFEIDADGDEEAFARGVLLAIRRGDVSGSSFSFMLAPAGQRFVIGTGSEPDVREISDIAMVGDVGPVAQPAYRATTSSASMHDDDEDEEDDDDEEFWPDRSIHAAWQEARRSAGIGVPRPQPPRRQATPDADYGDMLRRRLAVAEAEQRVLERQGRDLEHQRREHRLRELEEEIGRQPQRYGVPLTADDELVWEAAQRARAASRQGR